MNGSQSKLLITQIHAKHNNRNIKIQNKKKIQKKWLDRKSRERENRREKKKKKKRQGNGERKEKQRRKPGEKKEVTLLDRWEAYTSSSSSSFSSVERFTKENGNKRENGISGAGNRSQGQVDGLETEEKGRCTRDSVYAILCYRGELLHCLGSERREDTHENARMCPV